MCIVEKMLIDNIIRMVPQKGGDPTISPTTVPKFLQLCQQGSKMVTSYTYICTLLITKLVLRLNI